MFPKAVGPRDTCHRALGAIRERSGERVCGAAVAGPSAVCHTPRLASIRFQIPGGEGMLVRRAPRVQWLLLVLAVSLIPVAFAFTTRSTVGVQPDGSILVPNGQALTPAGTHIDVNDRPLGMVLSPDRHVLAVVTGSNFAPRALHLIDVGAMTVKQTIAIANSFVGVAFNPAGNKIYVGGGASNDVKMFAAAPDGTFAAAGTIPIAGAAPSGLSLSADGTRLYVALNMTHELGVIDTATSTVVKRVP